MTKLRNKHYYDEFSTTYERHRHDGYHAFIDELTTDLVRQYVTPSTQLLEAGCGTGLILNRLVPHAKVAVGVDLSSGMLRHAAARNLQVVQGSVTDLPFADRSFDLVCSFKVLAHVEQIQQAMHELSRVLRPGGYLLTDALGRLGGEAIMRMRNRVVAELKTTFASSYTKTIGLTDILDLDQLVASSRRSTGEKFLINPSSDRP